MLMRIDYDKLINKYFVDEKMYMFTKLLFSKNIYVFFTIFEYLIEKIIISCPPDNIYTVYTWDGGGHGGGVGCMHAYVGVRACVRAQHGAVVCTDVCGRVDFLYVYLCVCMCVCVWGGGGGGGGQGGVYNLDIL